MHGYFQGEIQRVDVADGRLELRCVREYFYPDGFVGDEVWIWLIERPAPESVEVARKLCGRVVGDFVMTQDAGLHRLVVTLDDHQTCTLVGARIQKQEEPLTESDLWAVVAAVSDKTAGPPENDGILHRRASDVEAFLYAKIDHLRHQVEMEESRDSTRAGVLRWQVEDLETMLKTLRFGGR
ncbi:MAG: hypothetical protein JNN01_00610 [Opitutaceae bacterium]|nr:hypothetical protein [Opitutaceae bacterium]